MTGTLELPYKKHLAFQAESQYTLGSDHGFDEAYSALANGGVASADVESLKAKVIDALNAIFDELDSQPTERREKLFLADFRKHTVRLLEEDLGVFVRRSTGNGISNGKNVIDASSRQFNEQKYLQGQISKEAVDKMNSMTASLIAKFRENARNGKTKRTELSQNTGILNRRVVSLLNSEFKKHGILDVISKYMGTEMTVSGVAIELSVPNANWWKVDYTAYEHPPKTLYFHFDESIAFPKSIVYLTDVNERTGATSCAPNFIANSGLTPLQHLVGRSIGLVGREANTELLSYYDHKYHQAMGCPVFRKDYSRLPEQLRFSSHFGWDVIPDSQLETFLLSDEKKIVGRAGTFIAFDGGFLPHRGGLIQDGDRVALQVVFDKKISLIKRAIRKARKLVFKA